MKGRFWRDEQRTAAGTPTRAVAGCQTLVGLAAQNVFSIPMVERLGPGDPGQGCVPARIFVLTNSPGLDADQPAHTLGHRDGEANVGNCDRGEELGLRPRAALSAFAPSWRIRIRHLLSRAGTWVLGHGDAEAVASADCVTSLLDRNSNFFIGRTAPIMLASCTRMHQQRPNRPLPCSLTLRSRWMR